MAVVLQEIPAGNCGECSGGIVRFAAVDGANVDLAGIVIDADKRVTTMAMLVANQVVEYVPIDDNSAKYDSTGERSGNVHRSNQELFGKFPCLTNDKVLAGELLKDACWLVIMVEYSNGMCAMQGIDAVPDGAGGYKAVWSKTKAKATISAFSDTQDNEDRLEVTINSVSRNVLLPTVTTSLDLDVFLGL